MTTPTGSKLVLVDSSGWVEYFGEGPKADLFAPYLEREESLLLPTVVLYEVYKKLLRDKGPTTAERFLSYALRFGTRGIVLDAHLALLAARTSLEQKLGMADAIIYATAQLFHAELVTTDPHFQGKPGVTIV